MTLRRWLLMALGATTGLLVALLITRPGHEAAPSGGGSGLLSPDERVAAPDLTLTDTRGVTLRLSELRGRVVAVFFGYTHCPDVCPVTLARLATVDRAVDTPAELELLFVSVDPARDSAEVIERYVSAFDADIRGLTGPESAVREQAAAFGVGFQAGTPGSDGGYLVDHTARAFLVDREGRIAARAPSSATADELAAMVDVLLDERSPR